MERASHIRVLFPEDTRAATIAALGEWAINHLPVWWALAVRADHTQRGAAIAAHTRMARWRNVIGPCKSRTCLRLVGGTCWPPECQLAHCSRKRVRRLERRQPRGDYVRRRTRVSGRIAYRRGPHGLDIAAGAEPLRGDINAGEDIGPYIAVSERLQSLQLATHPPLFGPFSRPDVITAWLRRFATPDAWLECDISARNEALPPRKDRIPAQPLQGHLRSASTRRHRGCRPNTSSARRPFLLIPWAARRGPIRGRTWRSRRDFSLGHSVAVPFRLIMR